MATVRVFLLFIFVAFACGGVDSAKGKLWTVNIDQGAIRGYKESGNSYFAFFGIPYATAPTGLDKFKAPRPAPRWVNTLEATNRYIMCPQNPLITALLRDKKNYLVTENCLIANVYVPDNKEKQLPVVVYIHGGAYQIGFGNMLSHTPIVETGKVIVVNFNYRLGAHGFLCLGTEDVPGNAGLKDQVAALRWVRNNIAKFRGNPDDITIAGYSAGAVSANLLMLSPVTQGLFNKVIIESGPATTVWGVQVDPIENAKQYALSHNFTNVNDINSLEKFYKTTSLDVLQSDIFFSTKDTAITFVPCVENTSQDGNILSEAPVDLFKKSNLEDISLMIGIADMEGMFRLPVFDTWMEDMNKNFSDFLPADLTFKNEEQRNKVAEEIKRFYFDNKNINVGTIQGYVDYFTDAVYAYPTLKSIRSFIENGGKSAYLYKYSYVDGSQKYLHDFKGTNHCAQSAALSVNALDDDVEPKSKNYERLRSTMVDLWVNFITNGAPVPDKSEVFPSGWPEYSTENEEYMELNVHSELQKGIFKKRMEFWDRIHSQYYRKPIPPVSSSHNLRTEL